MAEEYECRICFCSSGDINEFISPCCCTGSGQHIHKDCLNKWFESNEGTEKYFRCQDCHCYYNRSGDEIKKEKVRFNANISMLTITTLSISTLILLLILCGLSKLICNIILVCIYLITLVYVVTFGNWIYWIVIVITLIGLCSNFRIKTLITDIWLIAAFLVSSYHFIDDGWEYIYDQVDKDNNKFEHPQMFDRFLGRYVDGVM